MFNRSRIGATVVCLITSNMDRAGAPGNVVLKKGDARLPKSSVVHVSQMATVDKLDLQDRIGRLPQSALSAVLAGLQLVLKSESSPLPLNA